MNSYTGFHPSKGWKPDKVPANIDPKVFFKKYVATRTPCIIEGELVDKDWKASRWLNFDYLKKRAGDAIVEVEGRSGNSDTFGSGRPRLNAMFRDVLDDLNEGNTDIYLSTQYGNTEDQDFDEDRDSYRRLSIGPEMQIVERFEEFCHQPLRRLMGDFPLRPSLTGNLVPQQVRPAQMEAVLVSTMVRFAFYGADVADFADNIYVLLRGRKRFTVFSPKDAENLYLHGGIKMVHSNGLVQYSDQKIRADGAYISDVLRWKLRKAKAEWEANKDGPKEEQSRERMEIASLELAEFQAENGDFEDEDLDLIQDDFDTEDEEMDLDTESNDVPAEDDENDSSEEEDADLFPTASEKDSSAAWFHEVHSYPEKKSSQPAVHMAFNYWFHPPTRTQYDQPYEDNFWDERFKEIEELLEGSRSGPLISLMSRRNPGAWIVRRRTDGKYLGEATKATRPNRLYF
ncbi:DnaJ sub C member 7 [Phlyctochytrium bullatum]|nr:DnaJ sub C member 7 [Phlyctochytrium bullatum]